MLWELWRLNIKYVLESSWDLWALSMTPWWMKTASEWVNMPAGPWLISRAARGASYLDAPLRFPTASCAQFPTTCIQDWAAPVLQLIRYFRWKWFIWGSEEIPRVCYICLWLKFQIVERDLVEFLVPISIFSMYSLCLYVVCSLVIFSSFLFGPLCHWFVVYAYRACRRWDHSEARVGPQMSL